MTTFDDREKAYESKYAYDEEKLFKAGARRNKLVGLWAAGLLGKTGAEAEAYAKDVILADFEEAGDDDVLRKLVADLAGKADADAIRARMSELLAEAKRQVAEES